MNDDSTPPNMLEGVRSEQQIAQIMSGRRYKGLTPFGTKLRQKVIDGIALPKLRQPRKPVLIIGITDGQPAGENAGALEDAIRYAVSSTQNLGPGAIAFQFAQVGNDQKGKLGSLPCHTHYSNSNTFNQPPNSSASSITTPPSATWSMSRPTSRTSPPRWLVPTHLSTSPPTSGS